MNFDPKTLRRFSNFVVERENVRRKHDAGAPLPWTSDPILAEWRFCNVNRNDDTVTKWIAANLATETDPITLVVKLAVGRFFNWPITLERLLRLGAFNGGFDSQKFCRALETMPGKIYTGAYMIRGATGDDAKHPKHVYLANRVFVPLFAKLHDAVKEGRTLAGHLCADWDVFLRCIFAMGDFMRNQIITDMKYTFLLPRGTTADWRTFCLAGPGTNRGLNRVLGEPLKASRSAADGTIALNQFRFQLLKVIKDAEGLKTYRSFASIFDDLNNVSNCLCEYDKYERVRLGEGTPRSRYTPAPSTP